MNEVATKVTDHLLDMSGSALTAEARVPARLASMVATCLSTGTMFPVFAEEVVLIQDVMVELGEEPVKFATFSRGHWMMTRNPKFVGSAA